MSWAGTVAGHVAQRVPLKAEARERPAPRPADSEDVRRARWRWLRHVWRDGWACGIRWVGLASAAEADRLAAARIDRGDASPGAALGPLIGMRIGGAGWRLANERAMLRGATDYALHSRTWLRGFLRGVRSARAGGVPAAPAEGAAAMVKRAKLVRVEVAAVCCPACESAEVRCRSSRQTASGRERLMECGGCGGRFAVAEIHDPKKFLGAVVPHNKGAARTL